MLQHNKTRYPVWASLAHDYLSVMASSVSSERAFSSAGITISKRHNRLKGDIVEALQGLKCMIRNDLLFREASCTVSAELAEVEDARDRILGHGTADGVQQPEDSDAPVELNSEHEDSGSWDTMVDGLDDDDEALDDDDDDVYLQKLD